MKFQKNKQFKITFLFAAFGMLLMHQSLAQTTYTFHTAGNWTDAANWSPSYPETDYGNNYLVIDAACTIQAGTNVSMTYPANPNPLQINADLTVLGSVTLNPGGGSNSVASGATLTIENGGSFFHNINYNIEGDLLIKAGGTWTNTNGLFVKPGGTYVNNGTQDNRSTTYADGGVITNNSLIDNQTDGSKIFPRNGGIVNNSAGATINTVSFIIRGTVNNDGAINNSGTSACCSKISSTSDGSINGTGSFSTGAFPGNTIVLADVGPGNSTGLLTLEAPPSGFGYQFDGILSLEVDGTSDHDVIAVTGTNSPATLGGPVNFTFGFDPTVGDQYTVITATGSISGTPSGTTANNNIALQYNGNGVFEVTNAGDGGLGGAAIPTMGEWSLIIFALIMLSISIVYVMRWKGNFVNETGNISIQIS